MSHIGHISCTTPNHEVDVCDCEYLQHPRRKYFSATTYARRQISLRFTKNLCQWKVPQEKSMKDVSKRWHSHDLLPRKITWYVWTCKEGQVTSRCLPLLYIGELVGSGLSTSMSTVTGAGTLLVALQCKQEYSMRCPWHVEPTGKNNLAYAFLQSTRTVLHDKKQRWCFTEGSLFWQS